MIDTQLRKVLLIGFIILNLAAGSSVLGQGKHASISLQVVTSKGERLPGTKITLYADDFERSFVSDANGQVRFILLKSDSYWFTCFFGGFKHVVSPLIHVKTGETFKFSVFMHPAPLPKDFFPHLSPVSREPLVEKKPKYLPFSSYDPKIIRIDKMPRHYRSPTPNP